MELLIIFVSIAVVALLSAIVFIFLGVVTYINNIYSDIDERIKSLEIQGSGYTSDPFEKQKETLQSTSHIIVPNTPDQIRNKNFQKIKEGQSYGNFN